MKTIKMNVSLTEQMKKEIEVQISRDNYFIDSGLQM